MPEGIGLFERLGVGLIHLCEYKCKHSFQDTLNPICNYGEDIETSSLYLLHCPDYLLGRMTLLNTQSGGIDPNILDLNNVYFTEFLLYGKENLDNMTSTSILDAAINIKKM